MRFLTLILFGTLIGGIQYAHANDCSHEDAEAVVVKWLTRGGQFRDLKVGVKSKGEEYLVAFFIVEETKVGGLPGIHELAGYQLVEKRNCEIRFREDGTTVGDGVIVRRPKKQ